VLKSIASNQIYEGHFQFDEKHGEGKLLISDPYPYEINGTFEKGELVFGETLFPDGSKYKGEFRDLKPNGKGYIRYVNGNTYKGDFVLGVREGKGILFEKRSNSIYEGDFKDDMFNGHGKYTHSDGSTFEGTFINNILDSRL